MTLPEIAEIRLVNQQLADPKIKSAVEMVEWFAAMQGQEYAQTKWGLGLRLPHLNDSDIETDLNEGRILRTHLLRPTWHFVSANDIHWLLRLTAPRVHAANAHMYRKFNLESTFLNKCCDILIKILEGGKHIDRNSINNELRKNKINTEGFRLVYILMYAELEGVICSGAKQGNRQTYALLDERVKNKKLPDRDEALTELAKRYFRSRGPATIADMATWSGLTISDCRRGIKAIKGQLQKEVVGQQEYFLFIENNVNRKQHSEMNLLPTYDEYIMGYKDRSAILTSENRASLKYYSMIVFNGQVTGTWKRIIVKNEVRVQYDFFRPPDKEQIKSFNKVISRLGEFLNKKIQLPGHMIPHET